VTRARIRTHPRTDGEEMAMKLSTDEVFS